MYRLIAVVVLLVLGAYAASAVEISTTNALKARPEFQCYSAGIKQSTCNPVWIVGPGVSQNVFKCRSSNRLKTFEACIDLR